MSNCANKQVARKLHSKIANISKATSCCRCPHLRGPNKRWISVQTSEVASRASFAKFRPNVLILLLLVLISLVGCDLRSNQSSKVVSLQSEGLWRPTVPISSLKSEISFEHQNLVSIPLAEQMCVSNSQDSQATLSSPINVASFAHNHIQSLEQNAFTCLADNLKILILRHNKIGRIADGAFNGLKSVQVLLLDNNLLKEVPSRIALGSLKGLRHLNLAHNKIEQLDEGVFGGASANLISLNLKGNPLSRLSFNSLAQLANLNTLTLSHSALTGRLEPLIGLSELRFYHLDRAANLSSISEDLCTDSRKLSSLVLKSNQLERIPQFASCHSLLLIDLSYNKINGPLNDATFERQTNLIDLYLGHNQIESISENSFAGLKQLQVLELSNNHLKWIHQNAFLPIRATITELDLSNNHQLMALSSLGLEKLVSLKVFGNQQLRELPHFKSASNLALTYAYHCCDYLTAPSLDDQGFNSNLVEPNKPGTDDNSTSHNESSPNLVNQLLASISSTFNHILSNRSTAATDPRDTDSAELDTTNLTEVIVWPAEYYRDTTSSIHLDKSSRIKRQQRAREDNNELLQGVNFLSENLISEDQVLQARPKLASDTDWLPSLIDELVWQVEEIRSLHSISLANGHFGALQHRMRPAGGKREANLTKQLAGLIDPRATELIEAELCEQVARTIQFRAKHSTSRQLVKRQYASKQQFAAPARCLPEPNAFLPCQDLFDTWWLRAGIWLVFLLAFTGNILVIVVLSSVRQSSSASALTSIMWLAHSKRHIDVPRFLVINLAIADLLMAFYLGILALVDLTTLGQFKLFAIKWQYSTGCKLAGFLGVLSSELSVFILAIITLERNYAITNAVHLNRRLSLQKAMLIMFVGYAFALGMAIMPLNGISDYRKFSICLPLDMDSSLSSQLYIITLIGINTISFVLLLSCYLRMYCAIRGSQAWNTNDLRIAKRMSILVLTDFLCWMPIIVVGLASLFGHHLVGTNGIKILTIFILPLNSIANPFLYAITTKKFKRDLDTLVRRARSISRSLNCSKSAKDPQVFFGYNQYQHELMMNKARKKKSGKHLDKNQQLSNQRCNVATTGGQVSSRTRYNARNQIVCTGNQVTMNRTTCSCGAQREQPAIQPTRSMAACNTTEAASGEIAVRQDQTQRSTNAAMRLQLQPKIVLDSADLQFNEIDHDMVQTKMPQSINRALIVDVQGCRQTCTGVNDRYSSSAFVQPTRHANHQVVVAGKHNHCNEEHRVCCCCGGHWQVEMPDGTSLNENRSRRPKSADTGFMLGCPNNGYCMNNHTSYQAVCFVAERGSSTASSHLAPANRGGKPEVGQQHHLLNVFNGGQSNQQAGDRSASACGYPTAFSKPARTACTASTSAAAIGTHLRPVASSYDTMNGAKTTRSTEKLSQSINKLLFGPVAKAWSSIQISLNSSLTQVAQAASQNLQVPRRASPVGASEREHCDSALSNRKDEIDDLMMRNNNNDNNSTTIDDLLLLGSPSNRLLKLNERRMSRSCDAISSQTGQQQNLSTLSNTSTSGNEPTTSHGDHDDDQRILLATIHRIAGSRRKQGQQAPLLLQQQQQQSSQYLRNRCTRCRSWSPALLSKLEDCIYQLRIKIPGLSSSRNTNHEAMEQVDDDSSGQDVDDNRLDQLLSDDEGERSLSCHEINEISSGDNVSDCDVDDSEDKFNERGLLEWTQKRQNMFKRHHIQRQSIKSNTNSDTLSTRTAGTVLTNMSVSFDSNTGVPVTCHRAPLADSENKADYADERKV